MHGGMHGGMHGEMQGKYYRYCSRSIRYSTDLNSENNKFDLETFDLVSQYCMYTLLVEWKPNKVAKVNSYGSFGLGVEFGTW